MAKKKTASAPPSAKEIKSLADLTPDDMNANQGTVRGMAQLEYSMQRLGAGRSVLVDRNGKTIAGNKSSETWGQIGNEDDVIVVPTDGTKLVIVQRTDLDLDDEQDLRARELAIADNRVGETNLNWDPAAVAALEVAGVRVGDYWVPDELARLRDRLERESEAEKKLDAELNAQRDAQAAPAAAAEAPPEFKPLNPEQIETQHACPKCGFRF